MKQDISVLLFCYNQVKYVSEAIQSVFDQTYKDWELILVDNASTDGTQEVLKKFEDNDRIKLFLHKTNSVINAGPSVFNEAIKQAKGEYLSILLGDDFYLPEKLEKQVACFKNLSREWGVVHSPGFILNQLSGIKSLAEGSKVHGSALETLLQEFSYKEINPISPLVRRECFERYPEYGDLPLEGESLYLKIALGYKFYYLDEPLSVMRKHEKNLGWYSKRNMEILDICLERLKDFEEFPNHYLESLSKLRARIFIKGAWENLRLGNDILWTKKRVREAFRLDPLQKVLPRSLLTWFFTFLPESILRTTNNFINFLFKKEDQLYFEGKYNQEDN